MGRSTSNNKKREQLWTEKLNKETRYVLGTEIDVSTTKGMDKYYRVLREAQNKNDRLGYGSINWKSKLYKKDAKIIEELTKNIKNNPISLEGLTKNSQNDNNNHNCDTNRIRDLGSSNESHSINERLDNSREYNERLDIPF